MDDMAEMNPGDDNQSGTITDMTDGEIEVSANINLSGNVDYTKSRYVFTTNSESLGTSDESKYSDGKVSYENSTVKKAKPQGTYYLHVLIVGKTGTKKEIISSETATSQGKKDFPYTGSVQEYELSPGKYKLEVWGAQGGNANNDTAEKKGGNGGYSKGIISINSKNQFYIYVGGKGADNVRKNDKTIIQGGFNGGGNSRSDQNSSWSVASGGGATDIRLNNQSLYSRLIVAGGGGAATYRLDNLYGGPGGAGGGSEGIRNTEYVNSGYQCGYAGTQILGGKSYQSASSGNDYLSDGSFGQGATNVNGAVTGGGGGGWYGGGAGYCSGSAGGSGWVYTVSAFNIWKTGNPTDANKYELTSDYYLTEASTIAGNSSFPAPNGGTETGHSGDGYARITRLN